MPARVLSRSTGTPPIVVLSWIVPSGAGIDPAASVIRRRRVFQSASGEKTQRPMTFMEGRRAAGGSIAPTILDGVSGVAQPS